MRLRKLILCSVALTCLTQAIRLIAQDSESQLSNPTAVASKRSDSNEQIYYRNKLEFSRDGMASDQHSFYLRLCRWRWLQRDSPEIYLGTRDCRVAMAAGQHRRSVDFARQLGFQLQRIRYLHSKGARDPLFCFHLRYPEDFVPRNWRVTPYFDMRGGIGDINAKEPLGVLFAQGQDLTFTYNMGAGVRYNVSPRYALSAGMNYMHISNAYLSQPAFINLWH